MVGATEAVDKADNCHQEERIMAILWTPPVDAARVVADRVGLPPEPLHTPPVPPVNPVGTAKPALRIERRQEERRQNRAPVGVERRSGSRREQDDSDEHVGQHVDLKV